MFYRPLMVACLGFGLLSCASARPPQLELPDFDYLRGKATETVDIDLGSFAFFLARRFIDDDDADGAAVKNILEGVSSMRVRHYEFADDFVYSRSALDALRAQLATRGWSSLLKVRDRKSDENVDAYVAMEKDKITGFVLVASEPREFTIVNVAGALDPRQVQALRKKFASDYVHSSRRERGAADDAEAADDDDGDDQS